jgi:hypothetical protein
LSTARADPAAIASSRCRKPGGDVVVSRRAHVVLRARTPIRSTAPSGGGAEPYRIDEDGACASTSARTIAKDLVVDPGEHVTCRRDSGRAPQNLAIDGGGKSTSTASRSRPTFRRLPGNCVGIVRYLRIAPHSAQRGDLLDVRQRQRHKATAASQSAKGNVYVSSHRLDELSRCSTLRSPGARAAGLPPNPVPGLCVLDCVGAARSSRRRNRSTATAVYLCGQTVLTTTDHQCRVDGRGDGRATAASTAWCQARARLSLVSHLRGRERKRLYDRRGRRCRRQHTSSARRLRPSSPRSARRSPPLSDSILTSTQRRSSSSSARQRQPTTRPTGGAGRRQAVVASARRKRLCRARRRRRISRDDWRLARRRSRAASAAARSASRQFVSDASSPS